MTERGVQGKCIWFLFSGSHTAVLRGHRWCRDRTWVIHMQDKRRPRCTIALALGNAFNILKGSHGVASCHNSIILGGGPQHHTHTPLPLCSHYSPLFLILKGEPHCCGQAK